MKQLFFSALLSFVFLSPSFSQCNNWLNILQEPSYVDIGNLNIPGTQITIEAMFNRNQPYDTGVLDNNDGDLVSKHSNPSDVNYLLRPNHGYITTTNGFFGTPDVCEAELNKTYYVAMVYDGTTLKFYRNGYLVSAVPATGNLVQNNFPARIGRYTSTTKETFLGYINEVRIWNVARTQSQLQQYMNTQLPNPATQIGLAAYYEFSSLKNLQGNSNWDGVITGNASINQTNPSCAQFVADTCNAVLAIGLNDLRGTVSNSQVHLYWTTMDKKNIAAMQIERSNNGITFSKVNDVAIKTGAQQNNYEFYDAPASSNNKVYYRLKISENGGGVIYSNILLLNLKTVPGAEIILYPNPSNSFIQVSCTAIKQQSATAQIKDLSGRIVFSYVLNLNAGYNSNTIYFKNHLPSSIYMLQLNIDGKKYSKKIVLR